MNAIEIRSLNKCFGSKNVLNNLDMVVEEGSIYGFIGENGSGKSTTQKILCGLLPFNSGTIKIFGKDYRSQEVKSLMSCLIEKPACYDDLSVWNNMLIQAYQLNVKNPKDEVRRLLKLVRMEGAANNKFKNCSLGMKQRVGIAIALLNDPKLIILDEPINALDLDGVRIVREILLDLSRNHKVTILVSSHILSELEKVATHYGIIKNGRLIKEMSAEEFESICPEYIALRCNDNDLAFSVLKSRYKKVTRTEQFVRVYDEVDAEDLIKALYKENVIVEFAKKEKISLEEFYLNINGGDKDER